MAPAPQPFWSKTLRGKVEAASKKAPRFLFAFATSSNEPKEATFSTDSITPEFFRTTPMPRSIFQMPLHEMQDHNYASYQGETLRFLEHSLWSTWETSLRSIVVKAICLSAPDDSISIVVLDTQGQMVIHDTDFYILEHPDRVSQSTDDVFLAFGVLPASCFAMVPLNTLHKAFLYDRLLEKPRIETPGRTLRLTDIFRTDDDCYIETFHDELIIAKRFGQHFGKHFELPIACMAIATLSRHPEQHIDWLSTDSRLKSIAMIEFEDFDIPTRGFKDIATLRDKKCLVRSPDARRAMSLLRDIVKSRRTRNVRPPNASGASAEDIYLSRIMMGITLGTLESDDGQSVFSAPVSTPTDSTMSEDYVSDDEPEELPQGCMEDYAKRALIEAQRHTPRYLFRGWRHGSSPSGGLAKLNTPDGIVPRAFLDDIDSTKTIYDLTLAELRATCYLHLAWKSPMGYATEFSSWAASLEVAARFANMGKTSAFISVIDTKELSNAIIHVPQLEPLLKNFGQKSWEYLAHGVIRGSSHKAIPLQAMININAPIFSKTSMRLYTAVQWSSIKAPISMQDIVNARSVGRLYGRKFGAAVMLAIICMKQRDRTLWRDGTNGVDQLLEENMSEFDIPAELCADGSILTDIVYTTNWGEVEQMIRMLRAIVDLRHGRGVRARDARRRVQASV